MQPSPCLHPIRTFNETLGTYINVPCGRCSACLASKGLQKSNDLAVLISSFKIKVLVTLTYDDYHLPLCNFDGSEYFTHGVDYDYNGEFKKLHISKVPDYPLSDYYHKSFSKYGGFPVLSHKDMINFRKRLRYFLSVSCKNNNINYEPIFIYTCGEYGSTTFRPHYHLLLGLQSEQIYLFLKECVYKAWCFPARNSPSRDSNNTPSVKSSFAGNIDFQRCYDRGAASYVAKYLACVCELPWLLQRYPFKPFSQITSSFVNVYRNDELPALSEFFKELPLQCSVKDYQGRYVSRFIPKFLENRFFPRFPKFDKIPKWSCYRLYTLAGRLGSSAKEFAQSMLNACINHAYLDFRLSLVRKLYFDESDYIKSYNCFVRFYYVIRTFGRNAASLGVSISVYFKRMLFYFSKKELFKLKRFYELQENLLSDCYNPASLASLFYLYYDTDFNIKNLNYYICQFGVNPSSLNLESLPQYADYKSRCNRLILDSTKTKKRNSYFESKGFQRPVYYPFVKRKFLKFL